MTESRITRDALPLFEANSRDSGPPEDLENYCSPDESQQVFCTTYEREAFESDEGIELNADVLDKQSDFESLVNFLAENYGLQSF